MRDDVDVICSGFKELNPHFAIRDATDDQSRLPTASTCVNLLKVCRLLLVAEKVVVDGFHPDAQLPRYTNKRTLKEKLLQAINSNAGFDLS